MKRLCILLIVQLFAISVFTQSLPPTINYQAVIRDANGTIITNTQIGLQLTILKTYSPSSIVWVELFTPTTDDFGLITLQIGSSNPTAFSGISWRTQYDLKVELDPTGGTNYYVMGQTSLLSVPYALIAKTAETTNDHYIGELFGGGIIFYVYKENGVQHGLIASLQDQSQGSQYSDVLTAIGLAAQSDWDGESNTNAIVNQSTNSAAFICSMYFVTEVLHYYGDWYLPSRDEMQLLCTQAFIIDKALQSNSLVKTRPYWTSTEIDATRAWAMYFWGGDRNLVDKNTSIELYVRAIRKF